MVEYDETSQCSHYAAFSSCIGVPVLFRNVMLPPTHYYTPQYRYWCEALNLFLVVLHILCFTDMSVPPRFLLFRVYYRWYIYSLSVLYLVTSFIYFSSIVLFVCFYGCILFSFVFCLPLIRPLFPHHLSVSVFWISSRFFIFILYYFYFVLTLHAN